MQRIADVSAHLRISAAQLGVVGTRRPRCWRRSSTAGAGSGVLAAFDHGAEATGFGEDEEATLRAFAASAATAVALAQTVQHERLRHSLDAAEAERRRWARELHDETLQGLGGLRVILSSALRRVEDDDVAGLLREGVGQVEREIENLRAIITELHAGLLTWIIAGVLLADGFGAVVAGVLVAVGGAVALAVWTPLTRLVATLWGYLRARDPLGSCHLFSPHGPTSWRPSTPPWRTVTVAHAAGSRAPRAQAASETALSTCHRAWPWRRLWGRQSGPPVRLSDVDESAESERAC